MPNRHEGKVNYEELRSECSCGFHSKSKRYFYEVREDILRHFEKIGTLKHTDGLQDGLDGLSPIKNAKRHLL